MSFVQVTLSGLYCGSDARVVELGEGKKIADVSVAYSHGKDDKKRTMWIKIKGFDRTAERIAELKKGMRVAAFGDLDEETWVDKQGVKHSQSVLLANRVESLDRADAGVAVDPFA